MHEGAEVLVEADAERTRSEVEDARAVVVETERGHEPIGQLLGAEPERLGDRLHQVLRLVLERPALHLLGNAVKEHERDVGLHGGEHVEADHGAWEGAIARPYADEGREAMGVLVATEVADREEAPLLVHGMTGEAPGLEHRPRELAERFGIARLTNQRETLVRLPRHAHREHLADVLQRALGERVLRARQPRPRQRRGDEPVRQLLLPGLLRRA